MWVLIAISILLGDPTGVSSVKEIRFNSRDVCETAKIKLENEGMIFDKNWNKGFYYIRAFCIYDGPFSNDVNDADEMIMGLDGLNKAPEKTFPNKKK